MRKVKKIFDGIFVVEFSGGVFGMLCRALREFLDMWGRGEIVKHLFDLGIIKFLAKPFVGLILFAIGFVWLWFQNQNPETEAKILDERGSPFERPKHPVLKLAATGLVVGIMMTVGVVLYTYFHSRVVTAATPAHKAVPSIGEKHETAEIPKHKNRLYSAHKASTNSPRVPPAASSDQYYALLACALGAGICNLAPGSAMVGNTIVGMDRGIVNGGASSAIYSNVIQGGWPIQALRWLEWGNVAPWSRPDSIRDGMDRLSHQSHTERGANAAHGIESRGAIGAQRFVQGFPRDPRSLGDLRHASSTGDVSQRRGQQSRIVGL
jgi:hypothetical protein